MVKWLLLLALVGCYDPGRATGRCEVTCSTTGACPSGLTCTDGLCYGAGEEICSPADFVRRETIAGGRNHVCAIDADSALACWGDNTIGQLGVLIDPKFEQRRATPLSLDVPSHERWVAVAAGGDATCAIDIDGVLLCWGDRAQLPLEATTGSAAPTVVDPPAPGRWQTVTLGDRHGCAILRPDTTTTEFGGDLYCWGSNAGGQVGTVGNPDRVIPTLTRVDLPIVAGFADWIEVGAADLATCARRQGGSVYCWGTGAVAGGSTSPTEAISQPGTFFRISVGARHACGSNERGEVFCWGTVAIGNDETSISDRATRVADHFLPGDRNWTAIAAGADTTCALSSTGEVRCFGDAAFGQTGRRVDAVTGHLDLEGTAVTLESPPSDLAAGDQFMCGVTGTGWECWGNNRHGQLGRDQFGDQLRPVSVGAGMRWTAVSAGDTVTCGVAGDAYCWGANEHGLLGPGGVAADSRTPIARSTGADIQSIAVASEHACFANTATVSCWGDNDRLQLGTTSVTSSDQPIPVQDNGNPLKLHDVVVGTRYSCGVDDSFRVVCWGLSSRLGSTVADSALPIPTDPEILLINSGDRLVGGENAACAIQSGQLSCWGTFLDPAVGTLGQVTQPTLIDLSEPASAAAGGVAVEVGIGRDHICAHLGTDIACWGGNEAGQAAPTNPGPPITVPTLLGLETPDRALAAGVSLSCIATVDGVAAAGPGCWGEIPNFTVTPSSDFVNLTQISVGTLHACGITADNLLVCWGRNDHNQLGAGLGFDPVPSPVIR